MYIVVVIELQLLFNCDKVAHYTVVATFTNGIFDNDTGDVGIFLECLPNNGFKVGKHI